MKEEKLRVEDYMNELQQLKDERAPWDSLWEEVCYYTSPKRDMWGGDDVERGQTLYDTRAVEAVKIEANGLVGWNAGASIKWMKLKLLAEELNEIPYAKDWLELCERRMYMMFHRSNFYDQLYEFNVDLCTVGTAVMLIEEDPNSWVINYSTRHPKETYLVEGPNERVKKIYRELWYTPSQIIDRYGVKALPEEFLEDVLDPDDKDRVANLTDLYRIVHIIEPRHERNPRSALATDKPFASVELMPEVEEGAIFRETGYDDMPVIVARWSKNSGEKQGRSPAMDGLSTIKRANQEKYSTLRAGQMAVEPPVQLPINMVRRLNLSPRGVNVYRSANSRIYPLDMGGGYPFGRDILEMLHDEIDDMFMVPLFRMLDRLDRQVTAREVMERQGERVSSLSGPLTRQNSEALGPMVMRTFGLMARKHLLPNPSPELVKTGVPLDVEFTGLLSQAQRRYQQAQSVDGALGTINGIVQMAQNPALLDRIDLDDLIVKIAEAEGLPASSIRELPEVKKLRKIREAAMAKAQAQAQMESKAKSLNQLSKAPEEGSPAEGILQGSGLV